MPTQAKKIVKRSNPEETVFIEMLTEGVEPERGFKNWLLRTYPFILVSIPYFLYTAWIIYG